MRKVQASVFMNMETTLSLTLVKQNVNSKVWADEKTVGPAQNVLPVVIKLNDHHLSPHQKQYPLKPEVKERVKHITENLKEQELKEQVNSL